MNREICAVCGEDILDDEFSEEIEDIGLCHEECCEFVEQEHEV